MTGEPLPPQVSGRGGQGRAQTNAAAKRAFGGLTGQSSHHGFLGGGEAGLVAGVQHGSGRLQADFVDGERVELGGFDDRHLLRNGDDQESGARRIAQEAENAPSVRADRPHPYRVRGGHRSLEHRETMPGRGCVDDDDVIAWGLAIEALVLVQEDHDFSEDHELLEAGSGGEEAVVDGVAEDAVGDEGNLDHLPDVFVHHAARPEVHDRESIGDLGDARADGWHSEKPRRLGRSVDFDEKRRLPALRGRDRQGGSDQALPDAALAGEEDEAPAQKIVQ